MTQNPGILLFGGAFNPPHQSHRRLLVEAMAELHLDRAIVLPTGCHPLKADSGLAPDAARRDLCELAFANLPGVTISDLDLRRDGPAYTVDTLTALRGKHPDARLFWLIGADNLRILDQWHDHHRLLTLAQLVVFPRTGHPIDRATLATLDLTEPEIEGLLAHLLDVTPDDVSSTNIRAELARGASPTELAPEVLQRVRELGLYGT